MRRRHAARSWNDKTRRRLRGIEPLESRIVLDSTVVFNEIHYHPADDDSSLEWIELHNQMAVDMDLSGWSVEGVDFEFPAGTVIGGGAKGEVWRQMMADIYNATIQKPNVLEEATSMGAAILAGIGAGLFDGFDVIDRFLRIENEHTPNEENRSEYQKMMPLFDACYDALVDVYEKMA